MDGVLAAGATVIVKGIADIVVDQMKAYIKRKQEMRQAQELAPKTR